MKTPFYKKLKKAQNTVKQLAQEMVEQDPRLSSKIDELRHKYDALRKDVENRFDQIEQDLWDWISAKRREAIRYQTHYERIKKADRFYQILDVKPGATRSELKQAWLEKMKAHHPDRFAQDPKAEEEAAQQARQINLAYQELLEIINFTRSSR